MTDKTFRQIHLGGERIRLRGLEERDLPLTMRWRNDERSLRWFKNADPLGWDSHVSWFRRYQASDASDCMFFAETMDGVPVGQTSVYNFSMAGGRAEVGRFLSDPELRGRGLFREALILTLNAAFDRMGLNSVHLEVLANNDRAIRLYQSVGFENSMAEKEPGVINMELSSDRFSAHKKDVVES